MVEAGGGDKRVRKNKKKVNAWNKNEYGSKKSASLLGQMSLNLMFLFVSVHKGKMILYLNEVYIQSK